MQGVFFRETVRRIAARHDVHGFVRNVEGNILEIDVEGEPETVQAFIDEVLRNPPRHARVDDVHSVSLAPSGARGFQVAPDG